MWWQGVGLEGWGSGQLIKGGTRIEEEVECQCDDTSCIKHFNTTNSKNAQ